MFKVFLHISLGICCLQSLILTTGSNGHERRESGQNISEQSKQNPHNNDLPEFLKQKLRARGILKDEPAKDNSATSDNVRWYHLLF